MHTIDRMSAVSIGGKMHAVGDATGTLHAAAADQSGNVALPNVIARACRKAGLTPAPRGQTLSVEHVDAALAGLPLEERMQIKLALATAGQLATRRS